MYVIDINKLLLEFIFEVFIYSHALPIPKLSVGISFHSYYNFQNINLT